MNIEDLSIEKLGNFEHTDWTKNSIMNDLKAYWLVGKISNPIKFFLFIREASKRAGTQVTHYDWLFALPGLMNFIGFFLLAIFKFDTIFGLLICLLLGLFFGWIAAHTARGLAWFHYKENQKILPLLKGMFTRKEK